MVLRSSQVQGAGYEPASAVRVLILDDDPDMGEFLAEALKSGGLKSIACLDSATFFRELNPNISLIFLDLLLPEMDGVEVLRQLGSTRCEAGIVLMSGLDPQTLEGAEQLAAELGLHVVGRLSKPFGLSQVVQVIKGYKNRPTAPRSRARPEMITEAEFWEAVELDQFVLRYQPQVDIRTNKLRCISAHVRWQHPRLGLLSPARFMSGLERLSLLDDMMRIVVRRGVAQFSSIATSCGPETGFSVAVVPSTLCDLELPDRVLALLKESDLAPERLMIEVTESGALSHLSMLLDVITRLRMRHIKLAIGSFGYGQSMPHQLKQIPAAELRLHEKLTWALPGTARDRAVTQKMIELGHEMGMLVSAQGVTTKAQLACLTEIHCDFAQGSFYSDPLMPEALMKWLGSRGSRV